MARTPASPAAPRVSPPDLPEKLTEAEPTRAADLAAARLPLVGRVDLAHATLEQCLITADADLIDLTGSTLLDVDAADLRVTSLSLRDAGIRRL